jgi:hypothetical protein
VQSAIVSSVVASTTVIKGVVVTNLYDACDSKRMAIFASHISEGKPHPGKERIIVRRAAASTIVIIS